MSKIGGDTMLRTMLKLGFGLGFMLICSVSNLYSQWEGYVPPDVDFIDMDSGLTVGSQIYHDLISDPVLFIQDACFEVCQVLYDRNEEAPVLTDVTYYIEDYDGISAKWGLPPHIYIRYSTRWVENAWDNSGGNPDAVLYETKGVLYHELTHGYQYDGNQIPSYAIEGTADAVRIDLEHIPYSNRRPGGLYTNSYQTTGFFLDWLNQEGFPGYNFLRRFNQAANPEREKPWSWDIVQEITGVDVDTLWAEYQDFLRSPLAASFTFISHNTNRNVEFEDKSISRNTITRRHWDFGDGTSSTQSNPHHTYTEDGDYAVTLTVNTAKNVDYKTHIIAVPYSIPYCQSQSEDCTKEWIAELAISNIVNPSGARHYSDFTDLVIQLNMQQTYPVTLIPGFFEDAYNGGCFRIWMDFNKDSTFNDEEELVYDSGYTDETLVIGHITIPNLKEDMQTRMRVSIKGDHVELVDLTDLEGMIRAQYNDSPHGEEKEKAFDNSEYTKYLTFHDHVWIQFRFEDGQRYPISSYSITSANDYPERDPKDWQLMGSNNGSSWVTIDTRRNQFFSERFQTKDYVCNNQTPYQYYRLNVTRNNGDDKTQFAELKLLDWSFSPQFSPQQGCGNFAYGEVEDYTVYIIKSVFPDYETSIEGFEHGFETLPWEHSGDVAWEVTSWETYAGGYSARAGEVDDGESSMLSVTLDCVAGEVSFWVKVSSESSFDSLRFHIDDEEISEWSGDLDWQEVSFPVEAGRHTFRWNYSKDSSVSEGDDTAWIDDIVFPLR
jgi:hypothetical protein